MTNSTHTYRDDPRNQSILISVNGDLKPRGEVQVSLAPLAEACMPCYQRLTGSGFSRKPHARTGSGGSS